MLLAQHWLVILIGCASIVLLCRDIQEADQEGIEKFGEECRLYMQCVPQVNFFSGFFRLIRSKRTTKEPENSNG